MMQVQGGRRPLTALLVEDSQSDAGLVVRQLECDGFDVTHQRVETAGTMRSALQARAWDIVLSDFSLPGFCASDALAILRETGQDIPFIVISGVIVDEQAIALMRDGASDYVMKSNLAKLAEVVRRAVTEAAERRRRREVEATLASSLQRHAVAIESAMDGYAELDSAGCIIAVNDALCQLSGRSREDLAGRDIRQLLLVEWIPGTSDIVARTKAAGQVRLECRLVTHSGKSLDVAASMVSREVGGAALFLFLHDISERKRREDTLQAAVNDNARAREALLNVLEDQREAQERLRESEARYRDILENNVSAMFVLDNGVFTYANRHAGEIFGRPGATMAGLRFSDLISLEDRDRIATELRLLMTEPDGTRELTFHVPQGDADPVDVSSMFSRTTLQGRPVLLGAAQDISERRRAQQKIDTYVARLEGAMEATLQAVSVMVELRDPYTSGHERRVGDLAAAIGKELELSAEVIKGLRFSGYVHDIGMISVPAGILSKPARLTALELELVRTHCSAGYEVLKSVTFPWPIAQVILQHHERLDGTGYPAGLRGNDIVMEARIVAVADVVEAMSHHRPYRPALGIAAALEVVEAGAGTAFDGEVVRACLRLFREKGHTFPP